MSEIRILNLSNKKSILVDIYRQSLLKCDHQVLKEHEINNFLWKGTLKCFLVALNATKEYNREDP